MSGRCFGKCRRQSLSLVKRDNRRNIVRSKSFFGGSLIGRAPFAVALLLVLGALVLSACGGSSSSSSSESATTEPAPSTESEAGETDTGEAEGAETGAAAESEATGTPIKAVYIVPLNSQATPTYEDGKEATIAFEKWTNSHGGIAGHPIEFTICDDHGEASHASACAREAVENEVVASIGSFSFFGANIVPVLEQGETSWFGACCVQVAPELESPVSFPLGSQPAYGAGLIAKADEEGCKSINAVIVEGAETVFQPVMENAAKAYGIEIGKFVTIPAEAKDESPVVAEALTNDTDCVVTIFGESLYKAWMGPWSQSGTEATLYGAQGNLNAQALKGFEEIGEGSIIGGIYADWHTKPWTEYREALEAADVNPDLDYGSLVSQGAWVAGKAFKQIAEEIKGPINHTTFLDQASKTTELDTGGLIPVLDLTEEWKGGLEGFNRLFNRSIAFAKYENGEVVPSGDELYETTELLLGKGKLGKGEVPK
jgi:branched-chain amino acid transport system substrate-binding protein